MTFDLETLPEAIQGHLPHRLQAQWATALEAGVQDLRDSLEAEIGGPLARATYVYMQLSANLVGAVLGETSAAALAKAVTGSDVIQAAVGSKPPLFFSYSLYAMMYKRANLPGVSFYGNSFVSGPPKTLADLPSSATSLFAPWRGPDARALPESLDSVAALENCPVRFYPIAMPVALLCAAPVPVGIFRSHPTSHWMTLTAQKLREFVLGKRSASDVLLGFFTDYEVPVAPLTPALFDYNLFEDDAAVDWGTYADRPPPPQG